MAPGLGIPGALTSCPRLLPGIFNKDLLATLHLLVALAKRFQPDLPLPTNVQVEVITMEVRAGPGGCLPASWASRGCVTTLWTRGWVLHRAGAEPG